MAFPTVKLVVRRLFADPDFRANFVKSPEETLRSVAATSEERRALLHLGRGLAVPGASGASLAATLDFWP